MGYVPWETHPGLILSGSDDKCIRIWTRQTCLKTLRGHEGAVTTLSMEGTKIISGSLDNTIKVWELETGQRLVTLRSHTDGVTCLQFNDFYIVSGSYDKTVKLWDFTVC